MAKRLNICLVMVGMRGTGKTSFLIKKVIPKYKNRVIIYDPQKNPAYKKYKELQLKDSWYKLPAGHYICASDQPELFYEKAYKEVRNALLVFEDAKMYFGSQMPRAFLSLLIASKQHNNDIIMVVHSHGQISPDMNRMLDGLLIMKTGDYPVETRENSDFFPDIMRCYEYVKAHKNKYICVPVLRGKPFNPPKKNTKVIKPIKEKTDEQERLAA